MEMSKSNWITLAVAICFTVLQILQPFIHAHLDAEHPIQHTGFHVGNEHEEVFSTQLSDSHNVSSVPHASHTISVASGIKQDMDTTVFAHAMLAFVLSIYFLLALVSTRQFNSAFLLVPKTSLRRRLPASRAPPKL